MYPARASMAREKVKLFTAKGAGFHATYHNYEDSYVYATVSRRLRFLHISVTVSVGYLS
jgi:hypothetical protein